MEWNHKVVNTYLGSLRRRRESRKEVNMTSTILKIISTLLLAAIIAASSVSCNKDAVDGESTISEEISETETEAEKEKPKRNRLIYFEDFEDLEVSNDTRKVIKALGWQIDTKANGAYNDNTSYYTIGEKNGNRYLHVENNHSGAKDSYVIILNDDEMYDYHQYGFTYQFDLTYTSATNPDRYIALLSAYGGNYYRSFHFRNKGIANNQIHSDDTWFNCDSEGKYYSSATDENSIITKLLGLKYDAKKQAFNNISVSIRYAINWKRGLVVSMRVNTPGYPGTGKWIIVSKTEENIDKNAVANSLAGGYAIAIKVGGAQNGYIDNIVIWEGVGDEPTDKSNPLIKK